MQKAPYVAVTYLYHLFVFTVMKHLLILLIFLQELKDKHDFSYLDDWTSFYKESYQT